VIKRNPEKQQKSADSSEEENASSKV